MLNSLSTYFSQHPYKTVVVNKNSLLCWYVVAIHFYLLINLVLNLFKMGLSGLLADGRTKTPPHFLKSVAYILQWWNLAQLSLTRKKNRKTCKPRGTTFCASKSAFIHWKSTTFVISRKRKYVYRLHFNT